MEARLRALVENSNRIVFFGGAGVSTESGIPDFRSVDGLYRQKWRLPPETILSHAFFESNPAEFYRFYYEKMLMLNAAPNRAHLALARLEREGRLTAVVTQNIDGLHQKAGSRRVLELHGSIHRNRCPDCGRRFTGEELAALRPADAGQDFIPRCGCGGIPKPEVVLYGESLDSDVLEQAVDEIRRADMLIIGGTSLAVYPAAGLIEYYRGNRLVLINKSPTPADARANLLLSGAIGELLGE